MSAQHPKYWLAYLSESPENRPNEITTTAPEILDRPRFSRDAQSPARDRRCLPRHSPASPGGVRSGGDALAQRRSRTHLGRPRCRLLRRPRSTSTPTRRSC